MVSKDSDFSSRVVFHDPPPRVIHVRLGNLKMRDFFMAINSVWEEAVELNKGHKLVTIFRDRLEAIE